MQTGTVTYEGMRDALTDVRGWLEILAGNAVGPPTYTSQDVARAAAADVRRFAEMLEAAAAGQGGPFLSFPAWDDAEDDEQYWARSGRA